MNNVYTLLLALRGTAAGGYLLRCRSSTMHTGIACVAAHPRAYLSNTQVCMAGFERTSL
jgi:hypothetical protein